MLALDSLLDPAETTEVVCRLQQGLLVALKITSETLQAAYELLRTTLPFRGWHLPPLEDVKFRVLKRTTTNAMHGDYVFDGAHVIRVVDAKHQTINGVLMTVAHEMIHMKQQLDGATDAHGKTFHKLADRVCKVHLWDRGSF